MISDILSKMVIDLDYYLTDADFGHVYIGETREWIIRFRDEAHDLRSVLDAPPNEIPSPQTALSAEIEVTKTSGHQDQRDSHDTRSARQVWIDKMMSIETAANPPSFYQKELFGRGWSKRLIGELLGEPDWTDSNPHGAGYARMRCWKQSRVVAAEDTPAFRQPCRKIRDKGVPAPE